MYRRLLLVTGLLLLSSPLFAGASPLRIVADEWAPFGGVDLPNGGISLDVISTILTRAGYTVSTEIVPWERALEGVRDGEYDILGNLFFQPDLQAYLAYSDPFYDSEVHFIQRHGAGIGFTDLASLTPYTIAVGAGYVYEDAFDRAEFLQKTEVTTVVQGVQMVANGRIDLTVDSIDVLNYVISTEAPELFDQIEILPNPLAVQSIHMGVRTSLAGRDAVLTDFNRILTEMRSDGSLDELLSKHQY